MKAEAFNKAMGAVIRTERLARGMSQGELGEELGVSYQQVHKWEHGLNGFAAHYLPTLARALGTSVSDLYKRAGTQVTSPEPTAADNDAFLVSRHMKKIRDEKLRRAVIDFTRKLAYEGAIV